MPAPPVRIAAPLPTPQPAPVRSAPMPTVATARAAPSTAGPSVDTVVSYPRLVPLAEPPAPRFPEPVPTQPAYDAPMDPPPPIRVAPEHTATRPSAVPHVAPEPPAEEYVPVRLRQGWNLDPLGGSVRDLEDDDEQGDDFPPDSGEPSALEKAWHQAKNDPYVLVVGGLSFVAFLLILAVFAFR